MMNNENLIIPFVQLIYYKSLTNLNDELQKFKDRCIEVMKEHPKDHDWLCDTYSSWKTNYQWGLDKTFSNLISVAGDCVIDFSQQYQIPKLELNLDSFWINISEPNDYQEYHLHYESHFSAVYYVEVPEHSGNIVFQNRIEHECMKSLPIQTFTQANSSTYVLTPKTGDFIIFRSNVPHMVTKNKSLEKRISIAMNFSYR